MITGHAYDRQTGQISAERYTGSTLDLATELLPLGAGWIEGEYDHLRQRVDVTTGLVVYHRSPKLDALERQAKQRAIRARMSEIDRKKIRPMSALLVDPDNETERARLVALDAELNLLRGELNQPSGSP